MDELELDLLLVDDPAVYEREHRPMVGRALRLPWSNLSAWLSRPSMTSHKAELGAWTPAKFRDNRKRKENLLHASAVLVDVDDGGDVDRVVGVLDGHLAAVHSTFSSTPSAPRCRIVLPFREPVDAATYEIVFRVVAAHLLARGVGVDAGCKDAGRLGFLPCVPAGGHFHFRAVAGAPIDGAAIVAAQPPPPPRSAPRLAPAEHRAAYVRAALDHAAANVAYASEGSRHYTLAREAFTLHRPSLGLSEAEIENALLPAFVAAAGEKRLHEGARTIRDAIRASGRGAA